MRTHAAIFIVAGTLLAASVSVFAEGYVKGQQVQLAKDETLTFQGAAFRIGKKGELLTVAADRPNQKLVYVLGKDVTGRDIALAVPASSVTPVRPAAAATPTPPAAAQKPAAPVDEQGAKFKASAGKTLDFQSDGHEAVSYHVYVPTSFDPSKPPAMIIMFSPTGGGKNMLKQVHDGCEKLGWIGVGCDEFKNGVSESVLDPKWKEVFPHIEKTVPHNPDLLYMGGHSGGALRSYDYSEITKNPWKGIIASGGWLGGKTGLGCPPQMAIARLNGEKDKNAIASASREMPIFMAAKARVKDFSHPMGHVLPPHELFTEAMEWLQASTVPGKRLPTGVRHPALRDADNGTQKKK